MRLDKFLASATGHSRKQIHLLLRAGAACVNSILIKDPGFHVHPEDQITLQDEVICLLEQGYWMLHKPTGVVCANRDALHPTVLDLLPEHIDTSNLQIAGRLDLDTSGLVLITTDGAWNHRLTSPRSQCIKRYRVGLAAPLSAAAQSSLENGLLLHGETHPTKPALVALISPQEIYLSISEGKYHQVKRMLVAVGNQVVSLHREAIGQIELDPSLPPGASRPLTPSEIQGI